MCWVKGSFDRAERTIFAFARFIHWCWARRKHKSPLRLSSNSPGNGQGPWGKRGTLALRILGQGAVSSRLQMWPWDSVGEHRDAQGVQCLFQSAELPGPFYLLISSLHVCRLHSSHLISCTAGQGFVEGFCQSCFLWRGSQWCSCCDGWKPRCTWAAFRVSFELCKMHAN